MQETVQGSHQEEIDQDEAVKAVQELLESDSPPTHALGETTDYRQVAAAWSKAHGLSFEEMVQMLETSGGEEGQRVVDEIRRNPEAEAAFRLGLDEPLSGEMPASAADDAQHVEQVHLDEMHPR